MIILTAVEIVKMLPEHIDGVMTVENLSFSIPWSRESFIDEVTVNTFARYFCAKLNDTVIGYAGMWKVFDEGHITNIAVHPEFRNTGIGSLLMEHMIKTAKSEGITSMTLEVRKGNSAAIRLYEKYNFSVQGLRKGYYADNREDALIMWKTDM